MLQNYFDKIYCINLKRRPDRRAQAEAEFAKFGIVVEFVDAVDGNDLPEPTAISKDGTKLTRGEVGCILSHLKIVQLAKEQNLKNYLVLEDDVEFCYDFNQVLPQFIRQLPINFDMIYFGGNHVENYALIMPNIAKINNTFTTHAIGVNHTAYDKLIEVLTPCTEKADISIASLHKAMNCYVFRPHLAWQRQGFSDILNEQTDYIHLKK